MNHYCNHVLEGLWFGSALCKSLCPGIFLVHNNAAMVALKFSFAPSHLYGRITNYDVIVTDSKQTLHKVIPMTKVRCKLFLTLSTIFRHLLFFLLL